MEPMPPIQKPMSALQQLAYVSSVQAIERREPHIMFLSYGLSRRMRQELDKLNITFEMFVEQACIDYLNKLADDREALNKYVAFSDLQLFTSRAIDIKPRPAWSYNYPEEDGK